MNKEEQHPADPTDRPAQTDPPRSPNQSFRALQPPLVTEVGPRTYRGSWRSLHYIPTGSSSWNTSTEVGSADQVARLEVRYPEDHLVFADSRRFAEEWTYRFLTTALTDSADPSPNG